MSDENTQTSAPTDSTTPDAPKTVVDVPPSAPTASAPTDTVLVPIDADLVPQDEDLDEDHHTIQVTHGSVVLADVEQLDGPKPVAGAYHPGSVLRVTADEAKALYAKRVAKRIG